MKKIEAIIRSEKVNEVRTALADAGFLGITVFEVRGRGRQKNLELQFRGRDLKIDLLAKTKIELMINDNDVAKVVTIIRNTAKTGEIGDGKITILPIDDIVRIRTDERGEDAL
jgi:nitrogen regulatory protein P-II 1